MKFEFFIAWRNLRPRQGTDPFASFLNLSASAGLALGIAALLAVLSVMNGFHSEIRSRILNFQSHIELSDSGGPIPDWHALCSASLAAAPSAKACSPLSKSQALASANGASQGAVLLGIDPAAESSVSSAAGFFLNGSRPEDLLAGSFCAAVGTDLARALRVSVGDKLLLLAPQKIPVPGNPPRSKTFTVCALFEAGSKDFDSSAVLANLADASKFAGDGGYPNALRIKTSDPFASASAAKAIEAALPPSYFASDWSASNANLFKALATEKTLMFLILTLFIALAGFNLVSGLAISVRDKAGEIAILRAMGASRQTVALVFAAQGLIAASAGIAAGLAIGYALAHNITEAASLAEKLFSVSFLSKDVYYINSIPSEFRWPDAACVCAASFALSLAAAAWPSWRASKADPAEALKNP